MIFNITVISFISRPPVIRRTAPRGAGADDIYIFNFFKRITVKRNIITPECIAGFYMLHKIINSTFPLMPIFFLELFRRREFAVVFVALLFAFAFKHYAAYFGGIIVA